MKREIEITDHIQLLLMKQFNVTRATVWRAMHYKRNGALSRKLRRAAIELGGCAVIITPEVETFWDHEGTMRQLFPNNVILVVFKKNSLVELHYDNKIIATYHNVKFSQIEAIQAEARIAHNPTFQQMHLDN